MCIPPPSQSMKVVHHIEVLFWKSPLLVGSDPCSQIIFCPLILACIVVTNVQSQLCVTIRVQPGSKWLMEAFSLVCSKYPLSSEAAGQLSNYNFSVKSHGYQVFIYSRILGRESQVPINTQVTQVYCDPHTLTQDLFSILHAMQGTDLFLFPSLTILNMYNWWTHFGNSQHKMFTICQV